MYPSEVVSGPKASKWGLRVRAARSQNGEVVSVVVGGDEDQFMNTEMTVESRRIYCICFATTTDAYDQSLRLISHHVHLRL